MMLERIVGDIVLGTNRITHVEGFGGPRLCTWVSRTSTELPNYMHWQNFISVYSLVLKCNNFSPIRWPSQKEGLGSLSPTVRTSNSLTWGVYPSPHPSSKLDLVKVTCPAWPNLPARRSTRYKYSHVFLLQQALPAHQSS